MDSKLRELVPGLITDYLITISASRQSASWDFGLSGRKGPFFAVQFLLAILWWT
jgi:hypothetical protein